MLSPTWQSAVEIHPEGWVCPDNPFWVAGWVSSREGLVPVDIRAWFGDQLFLGLCGLPRPDKETESRGRPGPPHAGFSFLLQPVKHAQSLRIEVCDQHGRWAAIFSTPVTSNAIFDAKDFRPFLPSGSGPNTLLRLLRAHHARQNEPWRSLASEVLSAEKAECFDVMPSAPFQGALEQLGDRAAVHYDHLLITGWVAHREQSITALTAFLDSAVPQPLLHGLPRPDAGTLFPDLVDGANSRFAGYLRIPTALPRPLALRIFADLSDGRRELIFLKRFDPVLVSGRGTDLPPLSRWKFFQAERALRHAGWANSWPDSDFRKVRALAWQEYQHAAPSNRLPRQATPPPTLGDRALEVVLVTHNLNFEGAPLFLLEFAQHLSTQPGITISIVSAQDGALRKRFEQAGIAVQTVSVETATNTPSDSFFSEECARIASVLRWNSNQVIVANTLVSFWAVHAAKQVNATSVFYVHESVSARRFFALTLPSAAIARAENAFQLADRVVFVANAAQRPHAALGGKRNFITIPGWIDVTQIQHYDRTYSRKERRLEMGWPENAIVFACVGSLMPRKGQLGLVRAIQRMLINFSADYPIIFLVVGAKPGPDPYADLVRDFVATHALENVQFVNHSTDAYRYFQASDVFVCASLEEALPRVIMEAAAFGKHIVTTNVDGIPEILNEQTAWLVPPDDPEALAQAMGHAGRSVRAGDMTRANRAKEIVHAHFNAATLLQKHTALLYSVSPRRASFSSSHG